MRKKEHCIFIRDPKKNDQKLFAANDHRGEYLVKGKKLTFRRINKK